MGRFVVVVVAGARLGGKSMLIACLLSKWEAAVLDAAVDVGNARQGPDLFLDNHPVPVVLDEKGRPWDRRPRFPGCFSPAGVELGVVRKGSAAQIENRTWRFQWGLRTS